MKHIYLVEKNYRGAWVIYGAIGVRQYYNFTKKEAINRYLADCAKTIITNQAK